MRNTVRYGIKITTDVTHVKCDHSALDVILGVPSTKRMNKTSWAQVRNVECEKDALGTNKTH
jgi:hypothetical protein